MITAPKIDTDLLWDLATLFVILAVVYLIGVFFYNYRISKTAKKVAARKRELSPMVSEFLFLEDDASKDEKSNYIALKIEIRELLKESFNRRVLSEILLDLRKDVSGEARQSLLRLYQDLGLHKDAFAKLKSWRWQIISKGILELTRMEVAESYSFVTKFINDKRSTIRKQAEIATVTLRHEGINYFLDTTKYKISEWQQLKLLDVIRNKKDFSPPRFKAWLTSNNKYVVLFALRLIKYYNQNDADDSLIELVKHKNKQIKEEAIACIREFNITAALDTLKLVFWNCSTEIKIAILGTIGEIGSTEDIEFLQLMDKKELNFAVKSKALSSINAIAPETIMPSKGIQDTSRYSIPEDVSEKALAIHEKKHADIAPEKDEFVVQLEGDSEQLQEDQPTPAEAVQDAHKKPIEMESEQTQSDEEQNGPMENSNASDTQTKKMSPDVLQIEVAGEEVMKTGDISDGNKSGSVKWPADHLDFLPVVKEETNEVPDLEEQPPKTRNLGHHPLVDMEVEYEECVPDPMEAIGANTFDEEELDIAELAFLPIVVENEYEAEAHTQPPAGPSDIDINALPVHDETVVPSNFEGELGIPPIEEPLHELHDIPLPQEELRPLTSAYAQYNRPEIRNAVVIYEEVPAHDEDKGLRDIEVYEAYEFLVADASEPSKEDDKDHVELPLEDELMLQGILDDLIAPNTNDSDKGSETDATYVNPDWDVDESELDFIPVSFEKEGEETPSYIRIETSWEVDSEQEPAIPRASIPKAIFGDIEFEASTRQLLNDLEEMGDDREIPFLKELLAHEKYDLFKDRINALIDSFNHSAEKPQESVDNPLQPFSVFQDLFRTCDTEAKLILLNEVVAVGDEKDIHFLEDLIQDESPEIRKKAVSVLTKLKKKLDLEEPVSNTEAPSPNEFPTTIDYTELTKPEESKPASDPNDIFDLNFDFTEGPEDSDSLKKKEETAGSTAGEDTFLGQICQFSNKIVEKLNG